MDLDYLYDSKGLRITYSQRDPEAHVIKAGGVIGYLQRGILQDLAQTEGLRDFESKLEQVADTFLFAVKERQKYTLTELRNAIITARRTEEEQEKGYTERTSD